jgi:hypothetical protein
MYKIFCGEKPYTTTTRQPRGQELTTMKQHASYFDNAPVVFVNNKQLEVILLCFLYGGLNK